MDSRVIKINPNNTDKAYPYFAIDRCSSYIWLITGPGKNKNNHEGLFVSGNHNYIPFELKSDIRLCDLVRIDRMKLSFHIGGNTES